MPVVPRKLRNAFIHSFIVAALVLYNNCSGFKAIDVDQFSSSSSLSAVSAGPDQTVDVTAPATSALVQLSATVRSGIIISNVLWKEGVLVLVNGTSSSLLSAQVTLALGPHDLDLTVVDKSGVVYTDRVSILVARPFTPPTLPAPTPPPVGTPAPVGANLISNPGFENGAVGYSNYGFTTVSSAHSGALAASTGPSAGGFGLAVNVTPGKTYRFGMWAKLNAILGTGATLYYSYTLPNGTGVSSPYIGLFASRWEHYTFDVTIPAGVSIFDIHTWSNDGVVTYDDLSMYEVVPLANPPLLVDEGDSISVAGLHSTYYSVVTSDIRFIDDAVGGSGLGAVNNRQASVIALRPQVLTLLIGANDLSADPAAYAQSYFTYCDQMRANGMKVAASTLLPQGPQVSSYVSYNQRRSVFNEILRANVGIHFDALIDYAADPTIGTDAAATDTTLFPDGVHPSGGPGGGQEYMFRIYKTTVDQLLGR